VEAAAREKQVRAALDGLPDEQAAVVRLSFYEDKAHGDIARILGIPLGTVKSRLRLAMGKMRRDLGEAS
jgi:RNA polymerase sigma-70 factor, ECF subfamily